MKPSILNHMYGHAENFNPILGRLACMLARGGGKFISSFYFPNQRPGGHLTSTLVGVVVGWEVISPCHFPNQCPKQHNFASHIKNLHVMTSPYLSQPDQKRIFSLTDFSFFMIMLPFAKLID